MDCIAPTSLTHTHRPPSTPHPPLSLPAGSGSLPRTANGNSFRQGSAGHYHVVVVKVIPKAAIQGEAVGINPKGNHRLPGVQRIDHLPELGSLSQGRSLGLAARVGDWLKVPLAQPIPEI